MMKRRSSEDIICEELQGNLTQCDYTHGKEVASHCRSSNSGSKWAETRRVSSAATSRLSRWTKTDWWDEEGPPGSICSAVMLDFYRQVKAPVRWETSRVWVSSGLRCKPLNDSPVVFNNNLVALLQLFVLRSSVHLTHVGHQLLRPEALLHLRQLPLILLHRVGPMVCYFNSLNCLETEEVLDSLNFVFKLLQYLM